MSEAPTEDVAGGPPPGHMPQLDGLRGVAILMVLVGHTLLVPQVQGVAHWARLGVTLFFVLSGFLITGILLRYRDRDAATGDRLRVFYARRTLRIFPIYYLTLGVLAVAGYAPVLKDLGWHLTYTSNIASGYFGRSEPTTAHLWSLCVEEQFYLSWPWLVLFAPPRRTAALALGLVALGVGYKLIGAAAGLGWPALARSPFGCLDSLGVGALLAILRHDPEAGAKALARLRGVALLVGPALLALLMAYRANIGVIAATGSTPYVALVDLALALCAVPVLLHAAAGTTSALGSVLGWGPLRYLGRVSYAVYLFHPFIQHALLAWAYPRLGRSPSPFVHFAVVSAATVALAAISWVTFEGPINRLKQRFRLESPPAAGRPPLAPERA